MAKDHPDHHDAEIVMRLYELRREPVMRESRDALMTQFWSRTYEDSEYFMESNGEGFFLLAKVHPHLEAYRRDVNPLAFRNAEWLAVQCPAGRAVFAVIQARVNKLAEARLPALPP